MNRISQRARAAAVFLACGLAAAPSLGQNALGDGRGLDKRTSAQPAAGRALDRRLNVYDESVNSPVRDYAAEFKFRNAIVTGTAPGGLSFRGYAGYSAAGEFQGILGSDDLYMYRRDSVYSGLGGMGIRGTEALQYQFALTTGSTPPAGLVGSGLSVSRNKESYTSPSHQSYADDTRSAWLRSTSAYSATRSMLPTTLGVKKSKREGDPDERITASTLTGVLSNKLAPKDAPVLSTDQTGAARTPGGTDTSKPAPEQRDRTGKPRGPYEDLLKGLKDWEKSNPNVLPTPTEAPAAPGAKPDKPAEGVKDEETNFDKALMQIRKSLAQPRPGAKPGDAPTESEFKALTPAMARALRESEIVIKDYGIAAKGDAYSDNMRAGQEMLAAKKYFDAEDRFSRALMSAPGDPTAVAGRLHAQTGAGMYLSASFNVRQLFTAHPEVAAVKFAPELLPEPARLAEVMAVLRERVEKSDEADPVAKSMSPRDLGLLMAYLGHQTGDDKAVRSGLAALDSVAAADAQSARLATLLRAVWLGEGVAPKGEAAPKPQAPKPDAPKPEAPAKDAAPSK